MEQTQTLSKEFATPIRPHKQLNAFTPFSASKLPELDDCGTFPLTPNTMAKLDDSGLTELANFSTIFSPGAKFWSPRIEMGIDAQPRTPNRRFSPRNARPGNTPFFLKDMDFSSFLQTPDYLQTPKENTRSPIAPTGFERKSAKRSILGGNDSGMADMLSGTVEGAPIHIGDVKLTPLYATTSTTPDSATSKTPRSSYASQDDRKPYKRAATGPKRGEYKCGKCGFFPKKQKHNCDELARLLHPEDQRKVQAPPVPMTMHRGPPHVYLHPLHHMAIDHTHIINNRFMMPHHKH